MTGYVILRKGEAGWENIGTVEARSARSAVRERLNGSAQSSAHYGDGEYVAVPARSWAPVRVKSETHTELKFS